MTNSPSFGLLFATLAVVLVAPSSAAASDEGLQHHQLRADVGFASAVGVTGLTYTYALAPSFQVEAGVGLGLG